MTVSAAFRSDHTARPRPSAAIVFARHRGLLTAVAVFLLLFALVNSISAGHLSYFDISFMASGAATLAIAAIGETIVDSHRRIRSIRRRSDLSCQCCSGVEHGSGLGP